MPGRRLLSDDQLADMVAMREAGRTAQQIANHFTAQGTAIKASTIDWHCLRLGVTSPRGARQLAPPDRRPVWRGGHIVRPYTAEDDRLLLELEAAGVGRTEMCRRLGRKSNSITARLCTLARRDLIAEEMAA